jgi:S-adenosylmethionine uptake transporter
MSNEEERAPLNAHGFSFSDASMERETEERRGGRGGSSRATDAAAAVASTSTSSSSTSSTSFSFSSLFALLWNCGAACILTSALTRSGSAAALKGMDHRVRALVVVAVRSVAALGLTLLTRARSPELRKTSFFGNPGARPLLVARGTVSGCAIVFFYAAVERLPLADALALNFLSPILATLLAWAVHGERPGRSGVVAAVATVAGAALVCQPEALFGKGNGGDGGGGVSGAAAPEDAVVAVVGGRSSPVSSSSSSYRLGGIVLAVLSAFCAASGFTILRALSQRPEGPPAALTTAAYFHLCSLLASAVPLLFEAVTAFAQGGSLPSVGEPGAGAPRLPADLFLAVVLLLGGFAGQTLMNRAFLLEPASKMAALNTAQVLYGHFFALLFLGEKESVAGAAGSALIVAGAVTAALGGGGGGKGGRGGGGQRPQQQQNSGKSIAADVELATSSSSVGAGVSAARPPS